MENYFIYCLNLKRKLLRRKVMIEQFKFLNLKYEICEAIDHQNIYFETNNLNNSYEERIGIYEIDGTNINFHIKSNKYYQIVNNNGHVGCSLSHLYYIKKAYEENYQNIIMLEDDISFKYIKKWKNRFNYIIDNAPNDWTILKLHCSNCDIIKKYYNKEEYIKIPKDSVLFWSTGFYIINRKGMEYIINKYYNNMNNTFCIFEKYPVADFILYNIQGVYYYTIPLVKNNNIDFNFKSDIINRNILTKHEKEGIDIVDNYYRFDSEITS